MLVRALDDFQRRIDRCFVGINREIWNVHTEMKRQITSVQRSIHDVRTEWIRRSGNRYRTLRAS